MSSNNGQKGRKEGKEGKRRRERERENRNGRNRLMRKRRMGPGTRPHQSRSISNGEKKKGYLLCVAGLPSIDSERHFLTILLSLFSHGTSFTLVTGPAATLCVPFAWSPRKSFPFCLLASFQSLLCHSFFNPSRLCSRFLPTPFDLVVGGGDGILVISSRNAKERVQCACWSVCRRRRRRRREKIKWFISKGRR